MPRIDLNPTRAQVAAFNSATRAARKQMFPAAAGNGELSPPPVAEQTQEEIAARRVHPGLANRPVPGVWRPGYEAARQRPRSADVELLTAERLRALRVQLWQRRAALREGERAAERDIDEIDELDDEDEEYERRGLTSATRNRGQGHIRSGQGVSDAETDYRWLWLPCTSPR